MTERYWQNWDEGDVAKRMDRQWLDSEQDWRKALGENILAEFGKGATMLDVGCGSGLIYGQMLGEGVVAPDSYVGGDVSRKMLGMARGRFPETQFVALDILNLPYPDQSQPNVICVQVLQHLPNYHEAMNELLRVAGRKLYITTWFQPEDAIRFGPTTGWKRPFFWNRYSLTDFLSYASTQREDVRDMRVHHFVGGFGTCREMNYSVSMTFGMDGVDD